jgi:hypothetical protein
MRAHVVVGLISTLLLSSAVAQQELIRPDSREWRELFDPSFAQPGEIQSSSPLRKELFELLRPHIARFTKRPVRFEGTLRAFKNWALFIGTTVDNNGTEVTFPPMGNTDTAALWLRTRVGWHLVDFSVGHSDAVPVVWIEQYGVSRDLVGVR